MGGRCAHCGKEHEELEPAFGRPDAVFAVPEEERDTRVRATDDFVSIDGEAFFIRTVAPIPVHGRDFPYSWGFWVKVAREHFEEYERFFSVDPPPDHPGFQGTIANQTNLLPSILGVPVHVHLGRGTQRPRLMLLDDGHPLAQQQVTGLTLDEVHAWALKVERQTSSVQEPKGPEPLSPTLEREGWLVAEPRQVGKDLHVLAGPPRPGDEVKAPFVFLAADPHGEVEQRVEFMWVDLDTVQPDGWLSGALDNVPFVPGPIACGSRVWLRAEHLLAHRERSGGAQQPQQADAADRPGLGSRLARWCREAID
ncbi:MAG: DUF2199 domain-containing protein [Anaeromyxobacter sp.]